MKKTITITARFRGRDETRLNRILASMHGGVLLTDERIDNEIPQLAKAIICQLETLQVSMEKEKPGKSA